MKLKDEHPLIRAGMAVEVSLEFKLPTTTGFLIPISAAVAIGIWYFIRQNKRLIELPEFVWGYALSIGLVGLNLLALFRFILPAL